MSVFKVQNRFNMDATLLFAPQEEKKGDFFRLFVQERAQLSGSERIDEWKYYTRSGCPCGGEMS